ncbi:MAG: hypothetical protein C4555_03215 [Dehalococcoidia bacterium]|nr:MAG: hypothetical protein C4555_03215 [Dehalococcoidia bacterium]
MSFMDDLSDFGKKLVEGIKYLSFWVEKAAARLAELHEKAPVFVDWIIKQVSELMSKVESGEVPGELARETIVARAKETFHGSDSVFPEPVIRGTIEDAVLVEWAKRGKSTADKDDRAAELGYVDRSEIERARKAWPNFTPLD